MKEGFISKDDLDIYAYGLELFTSTLGNIIILLALSLIFNRLFETLIVLAVMLPMQSYAGGYHAKTHLRCFLIMIIGWFPVMWMIDVFNNISAAIVLSVSIAVIFVLAPVRHVNVPMSAPRRKTVKLFARLICLTLVIVSALLIFFGNSTTRFGITISVTMGTLALSMLVAYLKNRHEAASRPDGA